VSPNYHFKELLKALNRFEAEYLVVGGYAVMLYSEPRFTKDLDIWVSASPENATRVFRALAEFGAPLSGIHEADFTRPDLIYQLGVAPTRVDVLTSIEGVEFPDAWLNRKEAGFGDTPAFFIGIDDLIRNKRAVARPSDLLDCEVLELARNLQ
jgi:hypothetical protein